MLFRSEEMEFRRVLFRSGREGDGVSQANGRTLVTVSFNGLDRDSAEDAGQWFDESWALERADGDNQPWIITGIRQNG